MLRMNPCILNFSIKSNWETNLSKLVENRHNHNIDNCNNDNTNIIITILLLLGDPDMDHNLCTGSRRSRYGCSLTVFFFFFFFLLNPVFPGNT